MAPPAGTPSPSTSTDLRTLMTGLLMSGALSTPKLLERAHVRAIGLRLVPAFPECETATKLLHADVRPVINGWITVRSFQSLTRRSRASRTTPGRSSQTDRKRVLYR